MTERYSSTQDRKLTIIVVGYKSQEYLESLFKSLHQQSFSDFEIVFVDNSPEDGSSEWLKQHYPKTLLLPQTKNLGFAAGNNVGIKLALERGSTEIFLLNPDTYLASDCIEWLLESNDGSILQPLVLLSQGGKKTNLINTAGNPLNFLGFSYAGGYNKEFHDDQPLNPSIASGAASMFPAAALEKTGGFDESFFTYHEDVDLCWRARLLGYEIKLVPQAKVWHEYNFGRNKRKLYFVERNRLLFLTKCFQIETLLLLIPIGLLAELMLCLYALATGSIGAKLGAYVGYWENFGQVWQKRRQVQSSRLLCDKKLSRYLSTDLDFAGIKIPGLKIINAFSRTYWYLIKPIIR